MPSTKTKQLEHYKLMQNVCMYTGPIFAIMVVLCTLGYNHYSKKITAIEKEQETSEHSTFDVTTGNVLAVRLIDDTKLSGKIGLMVYNIVLVNISSKPFTPKEILFEYDYKGIHYSKPSYGLKTGESWDVKTKKFRPTLIVLSPTAKVYITGWNNSENVLGKREILQPGGTVAASAYFVTDFMDFPSFDEVKNPTLVIVDFGGKRSITPLAIAPNYNKRDLKVVAEYFKLDEHGNPVK